MSIIECVRTWLGGCPYLAGGVAHVDRLPASPGSYSVEGVPCRETVKRYVGGASLRQYEFIVAGREYLEDDPASGEENMELYESVALWMEEQTRLGSLPEMGTGQHPLRVFATGSAYPFQVDGHGTARYQLQCRLEYYMEGTR